MKKLSEILKGVKVRSGVRPSGIMVSSVTSDSRKVRPNGIFIAVKGHSEDGRRFIGDAVKKGARVIVSDKDFKASEGVTKILVRDSGAASRVIAVNFYEDPSSRMKIAGVTGTNGKTTITYLLENILKKAGEGCGVIGTINYRFKDKVFDAKNTTPGPIELQGLLASMVEEGVKFAAMEVSSHALDQGRVEGIRFDAAVFTNITKEHLDYHKTLNKYFQAKAGLFKMLKKGGTAILNADDGMVFGLKKKIAAKVLSYGIEKTADVSASDIKLSLDGARFTMKAPDLSMELETKLMGVHNVSNILAAAACSMSLGVASGAIKEGVESFEAVPGRLEKVDEGQPFEVFVDFAHTEDALLNVLKILRSSAKRSLITVFGCGGNRDRKKRPLMGRAACKFSDRVIITSDNPRREDPSAIVKEIEAGVKKRFSNYEVDLDRRSAIKRALYSASHGDIVLIAGKGHEKYQIVGDKTTPFDDCEVARLVLKERVR